MTIDANAIAVMIREVRDAARDAQAALDFTPSEKLDAHAQIEFSSEHAALESGDTRRLFELWRACAKAARKVIGPDAAVTVSPLGWNQHGVIGFCALALPNETRHRGDGRLNRMRADARYAADSAQGPCEALSLLLATLG